MKKLAICAVVALLTSGSAFAADNSFYLKVGGLGNMAGGYDTDVKDIGKDQYSDYGYGLTAGVGYHLMDNIRAEANGSYLFGIKYKSKAEEASDLGISGFKAMLNAYVDVANLGPVKLYVGSGLGASYINGKVKVKNDSAPKDKDYDYKLNFAYEGTVGLAYEISEVVNLDLGYKLESLGTPGNNIIPGTSWETEISKESPFVHSVNLGVRFSL